MSENLSPSDPTAGVLTPDMLPQLVQARQEMQERALQTRIVDVGTFERPPKGYLERIEAILDESLEPVHCGTCGWPGIVVRTDERGFLINHHGRQFACRVPIE